MNFTTSNNINNIPTNIYSTQLQRSYDWFDKMYMKKPTEKDWINLFGKRRGKNVQDIENLNLNDARSTAIILVGLSTCGKTTFSLNFVKSHPNFSYCSYDSVGVEVMSEFIKKGYLPQESILDSYTIYEFGEILKDHKKKKNNLIIDGAWVAPNSRGALINTLRLLGFKNLIIFSFLKISEEEMKVRLVSRAVRQIIQSKEIHDSDNPTTLSNSLSWFVTASFDEIIKKSGKTVDELIHSKEFIKEYSELAQIYFSSEPINTSLPIQMAYSIYNYGVDYFVDLF